MKIDVFGHHGLYWTIEHKVYRKLKSSNQFRIRMDKQRERYLRKLSNKILHSEPYYNKKIIKETLGSHTRTILKGVMV